MSIVLRGSYQLSASRTVFTYYLLLDEIARPVEATMRSQVHASEIEHAVAALAIARTYDVPVSWQNIVGAVEFTRPNDVSLRVSGNDPRDSLLFEELSVLPINKTPQSILQ